jgi:hypothetical protein
MELNVNPGVPVLYGGEIGEIYRAGQFYGSIRCKCFNRFREMKAQHLLEQLKRLTVETDFFINIAALMKMDEPCKLKNIFVSDMLTPETDLADINMDKI